MLSSLLLLFVSCSCLLVQAQSSKSSNEPVFICFEGKIFASQAERAVGYYEKLSELVLDQPGFTSQTPFFSIDQDRGQVLYVRFDSNEHLHAWKNLHVHLEIQGHGRAEIFTDYRLRIGNEVPAVDDEGQDDPTVSAGKYLLLWQYPSNATVTTAPNVEPDLFENLVDAATYVNEPAGLTLRISSWPTKSVGIKVRDAVPRVNGDDLRLIRVERDYGRFQRGEAPTDADRCQVAALTKDQKALKYC